MKASHCPIKRVNSTISIHLISNKSSGLLQQLPGILAILLTSFVWPDPALGQVESGPHALSSGSTRSSQTVDFTLDSAVEMALANSYRVRQLELGIQQSQSWLEARRARLRSSAELELGTPEIRSVSDRKWDSDQGRYEIVREDSRQWDLDFSIRQPVILFGYPTNGYLSINNSMYRLQQFGTGGSNLQYYNRYFIQYTQPLFQPNELKNNLERAEINLDQEKLDFQDNVADIIDDISEDYYDLFEIAYKRVIYRRQVSSLEKALEVAENSARAGTDSVAFQRLSVELGNAREQLNQLNSEFRLEASQLKQKLRLSEQDTLRIDPEITIRPVDVNLEEAVQYGSSLRPRLRRLELNRRESKLRLENEKGRNSFRAELEATYGREIRNSQLRSLWDRPENSYSIGLNISIPIWDWGRRDARLEARRLGVKRSALRLEEARQDIRNNIANAVQSLNEYQDRALQMQKNRQMAANISSTSLKQFRQGGVSALELIQTLDSQANTTENLLDAYLGYRQALLDLLQYTYYDFENQEPIFRRFDIGEHGPSPEMINKALQSAEPSSTRVE